MKSASVSGGWLLGMSIAVRAVAGPAEAELPVRVADPEAHAEVRVIGEPYAAREGRGEKQFTRFQGAGFGLTAVDFLSADDFKPPFFNGRGIAAGDVDADGFTDLVFATNSGVEIYKNLAGAKFERFPIDVPELESLDVFLVALVDIDNDGWLDLYMTSYGGQNRYVLNERGAFLQTGLRDVSLIPTTLTHSLSFGDIDLDGDLDVAVGNWFHGIGREMPARLARNQIHLYADGNYAARPMPGITGETLSILFSDFDGDAKLDLLVGNDFAPPDIFLRGGGDGSFQPITPADGFIPHGTRTTMSIDTADINNDLVLDIFLTQIAARATGGAARVPTRPLDEYCIAVRGQTEHRGCLEGIAIRGLFNWGAKMDAGDIGNCKRIRDAGERRMCQGMMVMMTAQKSGKPKLCDTIPEDLGRPAALCRLFFLEPLPVTEQEWERAMPQVQNENVLLIGSDSGVFSDRAEEMGVSISGWSWNSKIMDLDDDEWQDIYVVNGTWTRTTHPQKFFFHNERGEMFHTRTEAFGLDNYMIVSAYVSVDFDRDGDLDVITNSVNGPIWVHRNNERKNRSIEFSIRDELGNRFGIGTKLIIHYGKDGARHQIRELKAGGGFLSFDESVAHFGLGGFEHVQRVEVFWSTGEHSVLQGDFAAGARYRIERAAQNAARAKPADANP